MEGFAVDVALQIALNGTEKFKVLLERINGVSARISELETHIKASLDRAFSADSIANFERALQTSLATARGLTREMDALHKVMGGNVPRRPAGGGAGGAGPAGGGAGAGTGTGGGAGGVGMPSAAQYKEALEMDRDFNAARRQIRAMAERENQAYNARQRDMYSAALRDNQAFNTRQRQLDRAATFQRKIEYEDAVKLNREYDARMRATMRERGHTGFGFGEMAQLYVGAKALEGAFKTLSKPYTQASNMRMAGDSEADVAKSRQMAFQIATTTPGVTVNDAMEAQQKLRGSMGAEMVTPKTVSAILQESKAISQQTGESMSTIFPRFFRLLEASQKLTDPKTGRFSEEQFLAASMDATRALMTFRGDEKLVDLAQATKMQAQSNAWQPSFKDSLMLSSVMQMALGQNAGTALNQLNRKMTLGGMTASSKGFEILREAGLIDPSRIQYTPDSKAALSGSTARHGPRAIMAPEMAINLGPDQSMMGKLYYLADRIAQTPSVKNAADPMKAFDVAITKVMGGNVAIARAVSLMLSPAVREQLENKSREFDATAKTPEALTTQRMAENPAASLENLETAAINAGAALINLTGITTKLNWLAHGLNNIAQYFDKNTGQAQALTYVAEALLFGKVISMVTRAFGGLVGSITTIVSMVARIGRIFSIPAAIAGGTGAAGAAAAAAVGAGETAGVAAAVGAGEATVGIGAAIAALAGMVTPVGLVVAGLGATIGALYLFGGDLSEAGKRFLKFINDDIAQGIHDFISRLIHWDPVKETPEVKDARLQNQKKMEQNRFDRGNGFMPKVDDGFDEAGRPIIPPNPGDYGDFSNESKTPIASPKVPETAPKAPDQSKPRETFRPHYTPTPVPDITRVEPGVRTFAPVHTAIPFEHNLRRMWNSPDGMFGGASTGARPAPVVPRVKDLHATNLYVDKIPGLDASRAAPNTAPSAPQPTPKFVPPPTHLSPPTHVQPPDTASPAPQSTLQKVPPSPHVQPPDTAPPAPQPTPQNVPPSPHVQPPDTAPSTPRASDGAGSLLHHIGVTQEQFDAAREAVAHIESRGRYNIMGGSGGKYAGKYQLGPEAISDAAHRIGIPVPSMQKFLHDPTMQERFYNSYTDANNTYLMAHSEAYRSASPERRLEILGYAHNQGAQGASKWLNTHQSGHDGFGTAGSVYPDAIHDALRQSGRTPDVARVPQPPRRSETSEAQRLVHPVRYDSTGGMGNMLRTPPPPSYHHASHVNVHLNDEIIAAHVYKTMFRNSSSLTSGPTGFDTGMTSWSPGTSIPT